MKQSLGFLVIGVVIGLLIGVTASKPSGDRNESPQGNGSKSAPAKSSATHPTGFHQRAYEWFPKSERAFLEPRSDEERNEVKRLMRLAIEQDLFPERMKAVADLLAMMTPENAAVLRDAFKESWDAGFDFTWERSMFFGRYGEVMGAEGAEEFIDHREFDRLLTSWAQFSPTEAVAWVNELPPGEKRDKAVNRVMFGVGQLDPDYGLEVFESLAPEDQPRNQRNLVDAFRRAGGAKETGRLATELLGREEEALRNVGRYALHRTLGILKDGEREALETWLDALPSEHRALIDPSQLPEDLRPTSPEPTEP